MQPRKFSSFLIYLVQCFFTNMVRRRSQRLAVQNILEEIEDSEFPITDDDNIDVAFIPDPNIDDSEDDAGKI